MKKVLIVCHDNLLYGASKSLLDWVKTIPKEEQYKFVFLIPKTSGTLKDELEKLGQCVIQLRYYQPVKKFNDDSLKIKIKNKIRAGLCYAFNPIAVKKIEKLCIEEEIDLIHSNSFVISIGAELATRLGLPHVWHIREFMEEDHMMQYIYSNSYLEMLTRHSFPIYISESIKKKFCELFPINTGSVIYNTINRDVSYKKNRGFIEDGICRIIIVGKITKNKGQLEAIQVVEEILARGYNAKLSICGEGPDENYLKKYVSDHQLENNIEFLGFRNDVVELRKNMDIALMCSNKEAFGRVTVEGMYYENLVVGKKSAGTEEIICDKMYGVLYDPDIPNDCVDKIIDIINNRTLAEEIIHSAKRYAIENYSPSIFPSLKGVYQELLGGEK